MNAKTYNKTRTCVFCDSKAIGSHKEVSKLLPFTPGKRDRFETVLVPVWLCQSCGRTSERKV